MSGGTKTLQTTTSRLSLFPKAMVSCSAEVISCLFIILYIQLSGDKLVIKCIVYAYCIMAVVSVKVVA